MFHRTTPAKLAKDIWNFRLNSRVRNRKGDHSREDAKHVLSKVEWAAKAGDGIKMDFSQEVTETTEMNQKTSFPLFSPVKRSFLALLASGRDKL